MHASASRICSRGGEGVKGCRSSKVPTQHANSQQLSNITPPSRVCFPDRLCPCSCPTIYSDLPLFRSLFVGARNPHAKERARHRPLPTWWPKRAGCHCPRHPAPHDFPRGCKQQVLTLSGCRLPMLVAVHVGAGHHSQRLEPEYRAGMPYILSPWAPLTSGFDLHLF